MKKYKITVINPNDKKVIEDVEELSNTKKYLVAKYQAKYRFLDARVKVVRLQKKAGIQTNLIDMIDELTQQG
jgi:hypothetical protein